MCNGTFIYQYKELFDIMRRTRIQDFEKIEQARDLESVVNDKRYLKRANKKKATRRNRRCKNTLTSHLKKNID
jgi:hypothetical protein